jgi:hypothetical protein
VHQQLQVGQLPAEGVGGEYGDTPGTVVGDAQLGAGMGSFSAGDDAHAGRPAGEGGRLPPRQLGNLGTIAGGIGVNCSPPGLLGQRLQRVPLVSPPDESQYAAE